MATTRAIALKRADAMERIEAATAVLAERHGITVPPTLLGAVSRDPELSRAAQLASFADVLEQLTAVTDGPRNEDAERILALEAEIAELTKPAKGKAGAS